MTRGLVPPPPETAATFPVLDTLRAVGALCVLTTHVAFWSGAYTNHGAWGTLLSRLDVGVALFFVLSGFLLARPFLRPPWPAPPRPPGTTCGSVSCGSPRSTSSRPSWPWR